MSQSLSFLFATYFKIFIACSPIVAVAIYIPLRPSDDAAQRWVIAKKGMLFASFILFGALVFGFHILELIGVELNAFRISGGLVLSIIALSLLYPKQGDISNEHREQDDIALTPLAFPIITGPGAISAVIIYKSEATTSWETVLVYVAAVLIMITFYALFYIACFFSRWLKPSIITICSKLCGLLVLTLGIQMIIAGIVGLTKFLGAC